jgi:hypothetical protein
VVIPVLRCADARPAWWRQSTSRHEGSPAWGTVRHSSPPYNGQVSTSRLQEVLHAVPSATLIVVAAY